MNNTEFLSWHETAVVYQIYPRSFKDTNHDGVGDLRGIVEKLDYIKTLGADAIWISPIYPSPMKDFGYDISDYCNIHPLFGTLDDFDVLIQEAHKRHIQIIMDYVPSHTSSEHPWFVESRSSQDNPKRDWYIWKDPKPDGSPPNNWLSVFGGSRWSFDKNSKQYYLHTFLKEQPDLNWRNKEVQSAMLNVLRFWLDRGVDGFRMDAFEHIFKHEEFLDQPFNPKYRPGIDNPFDSLDPIYTRYQPELKDLIKMFTKLFAEYGNKFFVTETYGDLTNLVDLYKAGDRGHAPFNFHFLRLTWQAKLYKAFIDEFDKQVGDNYIPTYVLGNHDNSRVISRIGKDAARVAAMLQLTLRGIPTIYYGEEIGMEDTKIPPEKIQDPFKKRVQGIPIDRDPARTPMQWDTTKNAGFSEIEPWLPVNNNYKKVNVEKEEKDPTSMLALYKKLILLRKNSPALLYGRYEPINIDSEWILAYIRQRDEEKILVVLNYSDTAQPASFPFGQATLLCDTFLKRAPQQKIDTTRLTLSPHEGLMLKISR